MKINKAYVIPFLILIFAIFSGFIIHRASWFVQDKHFSLLAHSFLNNDLFLDPNNLPAGDYSDYYGKQYLYFGPLPSIILTPFVAIWGKNFPQMTLSFISLVLIYFAVFLLSRKMNFTKVDSFWLANFFVFGTVLYFVGIVNISAYVVQPVGAVLIVLSLLEYFSRRRWLVIGLLVAAAGATRITLFGMAVFYLLEIFKNWRSVNIKSNIFYFLIPITISICLLGLYNFRRFHSVLETGYTKNVTALYKVNNNYKLGWFNPVHIPTNIYHLLLKSPDPIKMENVEFVLKFPYLKADGFGMAIWFTSPLFIYLLITKKESYTVSAVTGVFILAVPSLLYMGIGASQYGYRYSVDFLPLLFLLLVPAFKKRLPLFAKILIAFGIIFNCIYMLSIWNSYPLLEFWKYI